MKHKCGPEGYGYENCEACQADEEQYQRFKDIAEQTEDWLFAAILGDKPDADEEPPF